MVESYFKTVMYIGFDAQSSFVGLLRSVAAALCIYSVWYDLQVLNSSDWIEHN